MMLPLLPNKPLADKQAAAELKTMLQDMKQEIYTFNKLQAPEIAVDLHQQMVDQNNKLTAGIDLYLKNIKMECSTLLSLKILKFFKVSRISPASLIKSNSLGSN